MLVTSHHEYEGFAFLSERSTAQPLVPQRCLWSQRRSAHGETVPRQALPVVLTAALGAEYRPLLPDTITVACPLRFIERPMIIF